jgi:FtsH-binding integral membrane protein
MISGILFPLFTILLLSRGFFVSDAYAYLDPGTGSVILQALIGVIAGVLITLKIYWYKLKEKLSRMKK